MSFIGVLQSITRLLIDMISYDTFTSAANSGTSLSLTHTPVGTPKGIFVFCFAENGGQTFGTITYGGVTVPTLQTTVPNSRNWKVVGAFLGSGIPTGPQTVSCTLGFSLSPTRMVVISVTTSSGGDTQLAGIGSTKNDSGSGANATLSITGPAGASYGIFGMIHDDSTISGASAGANQSMIEEIDLGGHCEYIERNTNELASGTNTMPFVSTSANWSGVAIAIEELASAPIKTWNGIPWANIKTINGIPAANIKTISGIS